MSVCVAPFDRMSVVGVIRARRTPGNSDCRPSLYDAGIRHTYGTTYIAKIVVDISDIDAQKPLLDAVVDVAGPTDASVVLVRTYDEDQYEARVDELDFEARP